MADESLWTGFKQQVSSLLGQQPPVTAPATLPQDTPIIPLNSAPVDPSSVLAPVASEPATISFTKKFRNPNEAPVIAVVGAGIAGLVAARDLLQKGYRVKIFDAASRVGGRVQNSKMSNGCTVNAGAEIVDADDETIQALCKELKVELVDRSTLQPGSDDTYQVEGKHYTDNDLLNVETGQGPYAALRAQIGKDQAAMKDANGQWTEHGRALDHMSADEYLRKYSELAPEWVQKILRAAFTSEIGRDLHEQSALNLIDFACAKPLQPGDEFRLYDSDETYVVKGGTEKIVEALYADIDRIAKEREANGERDVYGYQPQSELLAAHPDTVNGSKSLTFRNGASGMDEQALVDGVVCAMPAYALAQVQGQEHLGLDTTQQKLVADTQYNQWLKVSFVTKGQPWKTDAQGNPTNLAGGGFTDGVYQSCWTTPQADGSGVLTMLIGGSLGVNSNTSALLDQAKQQYAQTLGKPVDDVFDAGVPPCIRNWGKQNGCSLAPKPGTYVDLSQFSEAQRHDQRVGFAGSWVMKGNKFGFMENTAASALAAAQHVALACPLPQKAQGVEQQQVVQPDAPVVPLGAESFLAKVQRIQADQSGQARA